MLKAQGIQLMPPVAGVKSVNWKTRYIWRIDSRDQKTKRRDTCTIERIHHYRFHWRSTSKSCRTIFCISQTPERSYSPNPWTNGCVSQSVYLRAVGRRPFKKFSWGCSQQHSASPTILERAITCIMEVFQGLAAGRGSSQGTSPFITNFSYLKIQSLQDFRATFEKHKVSQKLHEIGTAFCETHQKHTTVSKTHDFAWFWLELKGNGSREKKSTFDLCCARWTTTCINYDKHVGWQPHCGGTPSTLHACYGVYYCQSRFYRHLPVILMLQPAVLKTPCLQKDLCFLQNILLAKGYDAMACVKRTTRKHLKLRKDHWFTVIVAVTAETHACTETLLYTGQSFCKAFFCFFSSVSLQPLELHLKTNIKLSGSAHMTFRMLHGHLLFRYIIMNHVSSRKPHFLAYALNFCTFGSIFRTHAFSRVRVTKLQ